MSEMAVPVMGVEEARERFARLRDIAAKAAPDYIALYQGQAWLALGYSSWDEALKAEVGEFRMALPRDERREAVAQMRGAGMSLPMIGTALGVGLGTVHRDLATFPDGKVETPDIIVGHDGRQRPAHVTTTTRTTEATKVEQDVDLDTGEILDDGAAVAEFVESGADYRRAVLRRDLVAVITKWRPPIGISPDEAAALDLDETTLGIIARAQQDLNDWIDKFTAARGTGLRVVNGGSR